MSGNQERTHAQLVQWRQDLIDLTRKNRLLSLPTGPRSTVISIREPGPSDVLARLNAANGWRFHYPAPQETEVEDEAVRSALAAEDPDRGGERDDDELLTNVDVASTLSSRLHSLERRAAAEWNDKGLRVLYLGLGLVRWTDVDEERVSPLLLVPVSLERPNPRERYRLVGTDEEMVVNPALAVKLSQDAGIELPTEIPEEGFHGLVGLVEEAISSQPDWCVEDETVLGVFSFHKEAMYRDLVANEEAVVEHPLVRALAGDLDEDAGLAFDPVPAEQLDEVAPPEVLSSILDADSTQRQCIIAARDGRSFVMDGPPGSGKSQTIANVISELLAAGKTVLFVSEKAAALDVVKKRLDRAGLGSFVLELHSHKATRREVARTLGAALQERASPRASLDDAHTQDAARLRAALTANARAQNEVRTDIGRSLHWAIGRVAELEASPGAPIPDGVPGSMTVERFAETLRLADEVAGAWAPVVDGDDFLWRDLAAPTAVQERLQSVAADLERARSELDVLRELTAATAEALNIEVPARASELDPLVELAALVADRCEVPAGWLTATDLANVTATLDRLEALSQEYRETAGRVVGLGGDASGLGSVEAEVLSRALAVSSTLVPPLPTEGSWTVDVLRNRVGFLAWMRSELTALSVGAGELAASLGLGGPQTLDGITSLIQLAELGDEPSRPEPWWFDTNALQQAEQAIRALQPIVAQYRALRDQMAAVFNDQIYRLDVEAFYESPTDVTPNLSRLSTAGRRNRRQLKACTLSGEISDEAVATLAIARQWRQVAQSLEASRGSATAALGEHYFREADTDVASLEQALGVAQRALELTRTTGLSQILAQRLAWDSSDGPLVAASARALRSRLEQWRETIGQHLGPIESQLLALPAEQILGWIDSAIEPAEWLASTCEAAFRAVPTSTLDGIRALLNDRARIDAIAADVTSTHHSDAELLGTHYQGLESDWGAIRSSLAWADQVRSFFGGSCSPHQADAVAVAALRAEALRDAVARYRKSADGISDHFTGSHRALLARDLDDLEDAAELLGALHRDRGQVDIWVTFDSACSRLGELGLGAVVEHLKASEQPAELVPPTIESVVLRAWIDHVLANDARCHPLTGAEREHLVDRYRSLDRQLIAHGASRAIDAGNRRRPTASVGEVAVIKREAEKKTRHMPIRKLLTEAGRTAQQLMPCFMMSPLSVSQYIPGALRFDAVIFDEASQVKPSDAINAIYRGSQLVVAGDNRQLPPTSFFDRVTEGEDEYDEEAFDIFESVLDLCRASGIRALPLRWHYRSRHESLITYSNRAFYESRLITYPGAVESAPDLGVELLPVDGVYERGGGRDNPIEARAVVDRVVFHAENHPDLTCGVVAFSEAQASRITWELEAMRRERSDLDRYFRDDRLEGFFVKNLENVQGDERDIIIFSVGYGPDEAGKFTMNFGPLNKGGGERRLNVAVTRAKRRVEVIASFRASDIRETTSVGVRHLKGYLDFAERGPESLLPIEADMAGEPESPFEEAVLGVLRSWGHDVVPQVGQAGYRIDLGIRDPADPARFLLGVECDGAAYHSSAVARDRDRLRQEVLEGLGWRMHRIWGPSWYRDQAGEETRLRNAIAQAQDAGVDTSDAGAIEHVEVDVVPFDIDGLPEWVVPYRAAKLAKRWGNKGLAAPESRPDLLEDILSIVEVEGPVVDDLVLQRLRDPWRVTRMTAALRSGFSEAVESLIRQGRLVRPAPRSLALKDQLTDVVRSPDPADNNTVRKVSEVPVCEIEAAIVGVVSEAQRVDEEELSLRVARILGWARRGSDIGAAIGTGINRAIGDGLIQMAADGRIESSSSNGALEDGA